MVDKVEDQFRNYDPLQLKIEHTIVDLEIKTTDIHMGLGHLRTLTLRAAHLNLKRDYPGVRWTMNYIIAALQRIIEIAQEMKRIAEETKVIIDREQWERNINKITQHYNNKKKSGEKNES
ncbi:hypothetical protein J7K74_03785 [Candidatus Woesearchaeota archaeon]|nr:hypothetical protein [Candidatus Woesearchaeota archaeon]